MDGITRVAGRRSSRWYAALLNLAAGCADQPAEPRARPPVDASTSTAHAAEQDPFRDMYAAIAEEGDGSADSSFDDALASAR